MSNLSLRLPNSLHNEVKLLAKKEGISINQFISSAVAEKMSSFSTEEYLLKRAEKGSERAFLSVMSKVANIVPDDIDKLD